MTVENMRGDVLVGHNQFTMWRCIAALAHADGKVTDKEQEYFTRIFDYLARARGLTVEQRQILDADLKTPQNPLVLLKEINDPLYRGQIMQFGLYLAKLDGVIAPGEKDILDKLHAEITAGLDIKEISAQARGVAEREARLHEIQMSYNRPQYDEGLGIMAFIDDLLLWMGIDVMGDWNK